MSMHFQFSETFCMTVDPWASEKPICCTCRAPVDYFGRKIDFDKLSGLRPGPELEASPSYNRIMVVRCHGSGGLVNTSWPTWDPENDDRPEEPLHPRAEHL